MAHDESVYPDPFSFKPERFLGPNPNPDPAMAFGFGRRICPGRFMAYESMWIAIACTLAMFNISKVKRADGTPDTPAGEYEMGFLW